MKRHPIIESVMADIDGLDFADDDKRQNAEDSIICTVQTLIDRLAAKDTALSEMRAENERNRQGFEYHAGRAEKERDRANTAEATLATVNHVLEAASDKEKGLYDRIETLVDRATAAEAELERAKKALEDAEDTLRLVERPSFRDPRYGDEVEALGLRIGFGALMASASASWREHLAADGDPVGGEFVAGPCHGTVVSTLAKIRAARAASLKAGGEDTDSLHKEGKTP